MLSRNEIKRKVIDFVNIVDRLSENSQDKEKAAYIENEVREARYLIEYNEWFIAFENLLTNLHEINYKMDSELIEYAKQLFLLADVSQSEQKLWWLDDLKKK